MIRTRQYILALGDLAICSIALVGMLLLRFGTRYDAQIVRDHLSSFTLIFLIWFLVFFIFNLYDIRMTNPSPRTIGRLSLAIVIAVIIGGFVFYADIGTNITPRTNLAIVGAFTFIGLIIWRRLFYKLFASTFSRSIIIVGTHPEATALAEEIHANKHVGRIIRHFKNVDEALKEGVSTKDIDLVIVAPEDPGSLAKMSRLFDASILTLAGAYEELFGRIPLGLINDELARTIATRHESYGYFFFTRAIEIIVSIIVLVLTSPLVGIAAVAKKLEDGGPIILSPHDRVGRDGKIFHCYKIRTMVTDAEKDGVQWTQKNDRRITPIGKILRKLHIDELPQFVNILKGDMALVGPRPERPEFVEALEKEIPHYYLRKQVAPGFTGWAQIKFRYARTVLDAKEKLEYDLYYAKNRTILLDIGILLKTIQIIFTH